MEPDAKYTLVGVVVLTLLAAVFGAALWLSRKAPADRTEVYAIDFRQVSLSGLQVDGSVTMRGIKIGRVMDVHIPHADIEAVRVLIEVDADAPVRVDTAAVIQRNLLTGLANIDLIGGTQNAARLVFPKDHEEYPMIPQGKSELQELQNSLPEVMSSAAHSMQTFGRAMERVELLLNDENQSNVRALLANLAALSVDLKGGSNGVSRAFSEFDEISGKVSELVGVVKDELVLTFAELRGGISEVQKDTGSLARDVDRAARKVSRAAESYENPRSLIFGTSKSERGPGE